ncbi:MAG: SMP-30/gluconolactonase/LRE family protein [Halioglobus sp.]
MRYQAKLLCEGFIFPETPRWHRGSFYCCSIDEGTIFRIGSDGNKEVVVKIDDWVSGWAFTGPDSDDIVLTSAMKRKLLLYNGSELREFADLSSIATFSINDMVRSHTGTCYVDTVNFEFGKVDPADAPYSPLLRVDPTGEVSIASDVTRFPNGMVITPDHNRLIAADSLLACLHQWDINPDGTLANHSIFASLPGTVPDGISLDAEGGVWVTAGHRGVFRVLEGGQITDEIDIGDTGATACMLGGEDGCTLLITTSDSHDRNIIYDNPTGRLSTAEVKVAGAGLPSWY